MNILLFAGGKISAFIGFGGGNEEKRKKGEGEKGKSEKGKEKGEERMEKEEEERGKGKKARWKREGKGGRDELPLHRNKNSIRKFDLFRTPNTLHYTTMNPRYMNT